MSDKMNNLAEQNKTILEILSIKNDQSKKIDDLQNINSGLLNTIRNSITIRNCKDFKYFYPSLTSGSYKIKVDGEIFKVRCNMDSPSGGWTVSSA